MKKKEIESNRNSFNNDGDISDSSNDTEGLSNSNYDNTIRKLLK